MAGASQEPASRWNSPAQAGTWNPVSHQTWCTLPFTCFSLLHMMARGAVSGNSQSSLTAPSGERAQQTATLQLQAHKQHLYIPATSHPCPNISKQKGIPGDTSSAQLAFSLWKSTTPRFSDQYHVNRNHVN